MERPEKLVGALSRALKGLDLDARMREARAMALWDEIVGPVTAEKTHPLYINRGTLVVGVSSSAWANQLNLLKSQLLAQFEVRVGPGVVRELRWKTGPWDQAEALPGTAPAWRARPAPPAVEVPERDQLQATRLTEQIPDPALRDRIRRALLAAAGRQARARAAGWVPCGHCGVLHEPEPQGPPGPPLCPLCGLKARGLTE